MSRLIVFAYVSRESLIKVVSPIVTVGSQVVAHTLVETGNGPNRPNTIDL